MDRREALKLLTALPMVKSIDVARVAPNDVIVIETDDYVSLAGAQHMRDTLSLVWPNRKVVVLDRGMKLRIAREG